MILRDKTEVLAENLVRLKPSSQQISHKNDPGPNLDDRRLLGTNVYLNYVYNFKSRHPRCVFLY